MTTVDAPAPTTSVPQASAADTARVVARVLLPLASRGLIVRRPAIVRGAEKLDLDRGAVHEMQRLRDRYGPGPVLLKLPVRDLALVLEPDDVHRVLAGSPDPFRTDNLEKKGALGHFQPEGVLVSSPDERADRRRFNEEALDADSPMHRLAPALTAGIREEAHELADAAERTGELTWEPFVQAWWRTVRRVLFGAGAREDHPLTDMLGALRADANWSYLRPTDEELRDELHARIDGHLARAEPGSVAEHLADIPASAGTAPVQQVPQWMFAYEPGGIAAIRGLALLAAHPDEARRADAEVAASDLSQAQVLPRLRAAVLDGLRLWPTTPGILRDTDEVTIWRSGALDAGAGLLIFTPFFHRDDTRLAYADRFEPELWLGEPAPGRWPLVPFSDGPAICPGRHLVLLTASTFLATLLERLEIELDASVPLHADQPMPSLLSPFHLRFHARGRR